MKEQVHLLNGPVEDWVLELIEAQKAAGIRVEVIRLDAVTDWGAVVDRVMAAESVATW